MAAGHSRAARVRPLRLVEGEQPRSPLAIRLQDGNLEVERGYRQLGWRQRMPKLAELPPVVPPPRGVEPPRSRLLPGGLPGRRPPQRRHSLARRLAHWWLQSTTPPTWLGAAEATVVADRGGARHLGRGGGDFVIDRGEDRPKYGRNGRRLPGGRWLSRRLMDRGWLNREELQGQKLGSTWVPGGRMARQLRPRGRPRVRREDSYERARRLGDLSWPSRRRRRFRVHGRQHGFCRDRLESRSGFSARRSGQPFLEAAFALLGRVRIGVVHGGSVLFIG